jgi:hypothetical protein
MLHKSAVVRRLVGPLRVLDDRADGDAAAGAVVDDLLEEWLAVPEL